MTVSSTYNRTRKLGRLIIVVFLLGALLATIVVLSLTALGIIAIGPVFAPKSTTIFEEGGQPFAMLPYFNYSSSPSYPYHYGAMGMGSGFLLNFTSRITGTISSTAGIEWFLWSVTNTTNYLLKPSFNATALTGNHAGFIFTTGNVISMNIDLILPAGHYAWFALDPSAVPSNITTTTLLVATRL